MKREITPKLILDWHGSDGTIEDLAEYMARILSSEERFNLSRNEILEYETEEL